MHLCQQKFALLAERRVECRSSPRVSDRKRKREEERRGRRGGERVGEVMKGGGVSESGRGEGDSVTLRRSRESFKCSEGVAHNQIMIVR